MSRFLMKAHGAWSSTSVGLIYLLYFSCCGPSLGNHFNTTPRSITKLPASTSQVTSVLKTSSFISTRMPGKARALTEGMLSTSNFSKKSSTMSPGKSTAVVRTRPEPSQQLIPGGLGSTTSQQFTKKAFDQTEVTSLPHNHSGIKSSDHIDWTRPESSTAKGIAKDGNPARVEATSAATELILAWTIGTVTKGISKDTFGTTKESKRLLEPHSTTEAPEVNRRLYTAFIIVGALLLIPITMWALFFLWKRCRPPQECPGTTGIIENGCQDFGPTKDELPAEAPRHRGGAQQCLAMHEEEDTHL
uniref:uncharacterized protein n=1 Tax=Myxine glutinosa TaxID=7769 RepID=UPI00358F42C2